MSALIPRPPETDGLDPRQRDLWVAGWTWGWHDGFEDGYKRARQDVKTEQLELELNDE